LASPSKPELLYFPACPPRSLRRVKAVSLLAPFFSPPSSPFSSFLLFTSARPSSALVFFLKADAARGHAASMFVSSVACLPREVPFTIAVADSFLPQSCLSTPIGRRYTAGRATPFLPAFFGFLGFFPLSHHFGGCHDTCGEKRRYFFFFGRFTTYSGFLSEVNVDPIVPMSVPPLTVLVVLRGPCVPPLPLFFPFDVILFFTPPSPVFFLLYLVRPPYSR